MPLSPGARLGAYEILARLGAGGMGEVYRARDTRLGRDVAIKILPEAFAADPERLARFEREARILAALSHPNIAVVYGLERLRPHRAEDGQIRGEVSASVRLGGGAPAPLNDDGHQALVMELVEGEDLAQRLARGPVPLAESLAIARQIVDALDAAHERGIVHRDLKPANIVIRPDGVVKVLDFGLAKAIEGPGGSDTALSQSPTLTSPVMLTGAGMILGTAAYMSPEQARGKPADKRVDIWAFGCVLFEMVTGERPFTGDTLTETLAAILERSIDWTTLPAATPDNVRSVLRRTLEKDPRRRLRDIADVRLELDEAPPSAPRPPDATSRRTGIGWPLALVATAVVAAGIAWYVAARGAAPGARAVARLSVTADGPLVGQGEQAIAISADGRQLAYVAEVDGRRQLFLRAIDCFEATPIPGTEEADEPAFSPDGRWLAFEANRRLKRVATGGGRPLDVCETAGTHGLSWASNTELLFTNGPVSAVFRVAVDGGKPVQVTKLAPRDLEHRYPAILPGGKALLYTEVLDTDSTPADIGHVVVESLETGERHQVTQAVWAQYVPTGHVIYAVGDAVFALPFDLARLEATGEPKLLLQGVRASGSGVPLAAVSATGSLAYVPGHPDERHADLVWVDRAGRESPTGFSGVILVAPRLAPDSGRVIVANGSEASSADVDLWLFDLARGSRTRLTRGAASLSAWAPDGERFAYSISDNGPAQVYVRRIGASGSAAGTGDDEPLAAGPDTNFALSWSPDGTYVAGVSVNAAHASNDIWVYGVGDPSASRPFIATEFREGAPTFSPDGKWVAFASLKSGQSEIYMQPFPGPGQEWTISTDGGNEPVWARGSGQLFYRRGDAMMVVDITTSPAVVVGRPRQLFAGPYDRTLASWPDYDATPDGQRLLMIRERPLEPVSRINVVLNWSEELKTSFP